MARGRGGNQPPERPAAVSGPGSLSRRTDGGPGSDTQPVRVPTGGRYGEAKALREQQQGAPLPDRSHTPPAGGGGASVSPAAAAPAGVFGPTNRPGESPTAGAAGPVPPMAQVDTDAIIRILYQAFPHPQLLRLIRRR